MATVEATLVENATASASAPETPKLDDAKLLETLEKAKKQVEFYFADSNLPYDKFMWTLYSRDPEHWIPISTIASFKRMKEYLVHGSEWLLSALRLSDTLEVDETGTKVRRTTEPQEPKDSFQRSVYAKGFPDEDDKLQHRLEEFFGQYGKTNSVRMRRDEHKKFKNSVFAEFEDFETVDKFLKADPKPTFDGKELLVMTKNDYCEMKIKEKGLTGKAASHRREVLAKGRGFDAFRENDKGKGKEEEREILLEYIGNRIPVKKDSEGNGTVDENDVPYVKGATLRFEGCGGDCSWAEIKDPIKEIFDGKAPYIKFQRGDNFGLVGFHKALTEEEVTKVQEAIKTINKNAVTWTVPAEDDEKKFQIERAQVAARTALAQMGNKDRGGRGGRGGRGRGGGRGGRGGRGGGRGGGRPHNDRSRNDRSDRPSESKKTDGEGDAGEKRKRAVEPDGGPFTGVRGSNAPPAIASVAKKVKTDDGSAAPAS
ncbi:hypothetical protein FA15DRAFT_664482 [Coprinopsis marcescibilis]|uniref:La-domain-containing protein n=1 Tax=Coprinopsis marcescibilis TaxID=230819 RepID=A0A5C3L9I9_COPMA|nr:hypothetical protein FA15DRAFT_664482 [Coprinopsis marcescibilis]